MGKFDGVLLVSDFDDTLYDSHCQVPRRNLEALDRFLAQGGRFTVATGRAHRTFAPYVHLAPVNAPVVLSNGSAIYDFQKDEFLVQTYLSPSAPQDLDGVMEAFPQLGMEAYHGEDIYVFRPNWITDLHMKKVGTDYTVCPIREMPTPWTKAILQQDHGVLKEVQSWLLDRFPRRYEAIFPTTCTWRSPTMGATRGEWWPGWPRCWGSPEKISTAWETTRTTSP